MITERDIEMLTLYLVLAFLALMGYGGFVRGHREYLAWVCYSLRKLRGME